MSITLILAIWGAALSTVLAGIKLWEINRYSRRIHVAYLLTGDPIKEDKIIIYNLSKRVIRIEHWELLWVTRKPFLNKKIVPIDIFENGDYSLNLPANSIQPLNFNGQYHFNWRPEIEKNVKLFIKLRIAGRKGFLTKPVYPKSNNLIAAAI